MDDEYEIHDPLTLNLNRQIRCFLEELPLDSPHRAALVSASSRTELLTVLSHLLSTPGCTTTIATLFRPLLLDLAARWLADDGHLEDRLEASALLLEIHPELFP